MGNAVTISNIRSWISRWLAYQLIELGETSLMFLVHPTLTAEAMDATCSALVRIMEWARG